MGILLGEGGQARGDSNSEGGADEGRKIELRWGFVELAKSSQRQLSDGLECLRGIGRCLIWHSPPLILPRVPELQ